MVPAGGGPVRSRNRCPRSLTARLRGRNAEMAFRPSNLGHGRKPWHHRRVVTTVDQLGTAMEVRQWWADRLGLAADAERASKGTAPYCGNSHHDPCPAGGIRQTRWIQTPLPQGVPVQLRGRAPVRYAGARANKLAQEIRVSRPGASRMRGVVQRQGRGRRILIPEHA